MLHHVSNKHEWILGDGVGPAKCDHEPLENEERDKKWLESGSLPHVSLRQVILKTRFVNTLEYFVNFRYVLLYIFQGNIQIVKSNLFIRTQKTCTLA